MQHATLSAEQLAADLAVRDLTDPSSGPHAIQLLVARAAAALSTRWGCDVRLCDGDRVVGREDNYDRLGFGGDDVTRDARYTRYVDDHHVLRSHTSALVPPALRALAAEPDPPQDVLLVCPGICYRRDSIDRLHTGHPHQLDLWRIARRRLGEEDLTDLIGELCGALVPGRPWRTEPRVHPYTLAGRQVDTLAEEWVEIAECGLAHPAVLTGAGLDQDWTGLALGMGLDRVLMLVKGIADIRLLRSNDERVASQMLDLGPYVPVSTMPPIRRDISVAVGADRLGDTERVDETVGDAVRTALGDGSDVLEQVAVGSVTALDDLPEPARARLGIQPGQVNLLVSMTFRALDRTLADAEANELRDRVYLALHEGSASMLAVGKTGVAQGSCAPGRPVA